MFLTVTWALNLMLNEEVELEVWLRSSIATERSRNLGPLIRISVGAKTNLIMVWNTSKAEKYAIYFMHLLWRSTSDCRAEQQILHHFWLVHGLVPWDRLLDYYHPFLSDFFYRNMK